ncbi:hypothetical protein DPEC_G00328850 [Dallia pectoralis]|uniref:Uncharacterized protein n=1 Tax=Dallia pectoralis TaxID=75939 RepID=A0ACC2F8G0_DALPE|nr:hypothetical protein DPEC_G00328850 [Dallia pectoralis]
MSSVGVVAQQCHVGADRGLAGGHGEGGRTLEPPDPRTLAPPQPVATSAFPPLLPACCNIHLVNITGLVLIIIITHTALVLLRGSFCRTGAGQIGL